MTTTVKPPWFAVGRTTWLLTACQALYFGCVSIDLTLTGVVGLHMAPTPVLATVPLSMILLLGTLGAFVAGPLTGKIGYPAVMVSGALAGAIGGLLSVYAVVTGSFVLLCVGTGIVGLYRATGGYIRFMAADRAPEGQKERALSFILAGGLVAALGGPLLATTSIGIFATPYAGAYLAVVVLALLTIPLIVAVGGPRAAVAEDGPKPAPVPVREVAGSRDFVTAFLLLVTAAAGMTLIMAVGPIGSQESGHSAHEGASIIQWHLVGMFAPSIFSGALMERIGRRWTAVAGCVLFVVGAVVGAAGTGFPNFLIALAANGVGWNLLFVSGSAYLIRTYPQGRGGRVQAIVEGFASAASVLASLFASAVYTALGWTQANVPLVVLGALLTGWLVWAGNEERVKA